MVPEARVVTVDWYRVFTDLQRCGVSMRQVARETGVPYWQCYNAYRSVTPESKRTSPDMRYTAGGKVLALWSGVTKRPIEDAPKLR